VGTPCCGTRQRVSNSVELCRLVGFSVQVSEINSGEEEEIQSTLKSWWGSMIGSVYSFLEYRYAHLMMRCFRSNLRGSSFLSGRALPRRSTSHRAKLSRIWVCICLRQRSLMISCILRCLEPRQEPILRSLPSRLMRNHRRRRPKKREEKYYKGCRVKK
jgi:hypothetical protein